MQSSKTTLDKQNAVGFKSPIYLVNQISLQCIFNCPKLEYKLINKTDEKLQVKKNSFHHNTIIKVLAP